MRARPQHDRAKTKAAMLAALPDLIRQWCLAGEQRGELYFALNPRRNDRSIGSFQINTSTGRWRDHAIGEGGGDVVSLYAYLFNICDYREAFKALAGDPLVQATLASGIAAPPAKVAVPLIERAAKLASVRRMYDNSTGLTGMPVEAYLRSRGLLPTEAWDALRASVRSYPGVGACPVLIAPIEALDGSLVGLHRTYLTPHGAKLDVPNPRLTLGNVRGGAIRLGAANDRLIISEGLEDGLTLYQELGVPVWVAGGASFLHLMAIPDTVRSLTIAADNDAAGERAAQRAADFFSVGGREVWIMRPKHGFKDFNDQIRGIQS